MQIEDDDIELLWGCFSEKHLQYNFYLFVVVVVVTLLHRYDSSLCNNKIVKFFTKHMQLL